MFSKSYSPDGQVYQVFIRKPDGSSITEGWHSQDQLSWRDERGADGVLRSFQSWHPDGTPYELVTDNE